MIVQPGLRLLRASVLVVVVSALTTGCKGEVIQGQVIDYFTRKGLAGVRVAPEGSADNTLTDRNGNYSLRYSLDSEEKPSQVFMFYEIDGYYTSHSMAERQADGRFRVDTVQVYRRPPGPGVYLVDQASGEYKELEQGTTCEQDWTEHYGGTYWRTGYQYLIDVEPATRNLAPPGKVTFVQYATEQLAPSEIDLGTTTRTRGLELVSVDDNGYVLTRQTSFRRVLRDHTLKYTPVSERAPRDSLILTTYDLGHGTYALLSTRQRTPILGYPFTVGTPNNRPTSICKGDVM